MTERTDIARRINAARAWPRRATAGERVAAAVVSACFLVVLGLAAWLEPAAGGVGTHEQLGMEPCVWLMAVGQPCPTCGMTTAFSHAAEGDLLASLHTQPFGAVLAVLSAAGFWASLHVAAAGSNVGRLIGNMLGTRTVVLGVGALLAAWVYKLAYFGG